MRYRALFIGGPLDGQERVTEQTVSTVRCRGKLDEIVEYSLLFGYGENTLVYSILETSQALDWIFDTYMESVNASVL